MVDEENGRMSRCIREGIVKAIATRRAGRRKKRVICFSVMIVEIACCVVLV